MKLEAKVAVVTGASKGIGAEIAKQLAAEGASVIVNYASSRDGADRVVAEITETGGKAIAVQANVSQQADIIRLFKETIGAYGKLDILVNNAGIYEFLNLAEITPEHFYRQYDLNVLGLILTTQEAVKHIGPDGGSIINMSSVVSTLSPAGSAVYNSTKSAVDGLTRSFAKELAPRNIRMNSINPGLIETEGFRASVIAGHGDAVASATPLGRMGQPQDIAPGVVFLASNDSSWMTGETLYITGGLH
ncbi:glucose 1-dehydrogenase [Anabaena cylindrica FACHB-243]|uniref:3-oxoacyl-(Acyl-carrier-protein) reductase n=1 Tax=Anabaena cylindrica (strain ATCC 27899 / PCC 7122) TaxID=272123 RepID=K9ZBY4_ANACC|nr:MULTISPECIES: glucose 1-dehydrogenase [Anabaena]AFZ56708.1 3-oxoacyl-(acyl-carrier-protein) reductase [Anabaena cylindrica PCC 7122]MBD2421841.1 glucose 1-dehydrogenase [Anabaena cylindrica FACHB-243]MCM2408187.1 glucose 1-dehydrogenase [Anabaena sp. CCAP 1446/1C]BAY00829.1 putative short chain dehydrogenase [Anabaena cylindrica PCC 7122]